MQSFLQQATEQESRSTGLKPLGWMALLVGGMITAFYLTSPPWVGILLGIFAGITMGLYLFAYVYCMFTDKDALRSETFNTKLALEKGFVGDSMQGVIEIQDPGGVPLLTEASSDSEGD